MAAIVPLPNKAPSRACVCVCESPDSKLRVLWTLFVPGFQQGTDLLAQHAVSSAPFQDVRTQMAAIVPLPNKAPSRACVCERALIQS